MEQKDNFHIFVLGIDIATAFDTVVSTIRSSLDISNVAITYNGHNGVPVDLHATLYTQGSSNTVSNNYHGIWLRNGSAVILSSQAVSITNNSNLGSAMRWNGIESCRECIGSDGKHGRTSERHWILRF